MDNEIISYFEMCQREGTSLQRGMNFRVHGGHSVVLTSVRPNAPYDDRFTDDGSTLIYEGHDVRRGGGVDPKRVDQPATYPSGTLTENGKFYAAAKAYAAGQAEAARVRVYEKLRSGIWSYNGLFHLVNAWQEESGGRLVFKFELAAVDEAEPAPEPDALPARRRLIPSHVKLEVWKRDRGRCVECGAEDELHFDHDVPYSKGGSSLTAKNVQLLCARHNLSKGAAIQ